MRQVPLTGPMILALKQERGTEHGPVRDLPPGDPQVLLNV